jgi:hypothetical protein
MLDGATLKAFVDQFWGDSIVPTLVDYIKIPNKSPAFDRDWAAHGYMDDAVTLFEAWVRVEFRTLERLRGSGIMCRSIKTLFNFDPPATDEEIRAASLQFVRKLSGFNAPSKANEAAFGDAVEEVFNVARRLIDRLETGASPRNREEEAMKARQRAAVRFGRPASA